MSAGGRNAGGNTAGGIQAVRRAFWAHLLVGAGGLALGFALRDQWGFALLFAVLGVLWFSAAMRGSSGLSTPLLWVYILALAAGLWLGIPAWLAVIPASAVLGAWDLNHFLQRLGQSEKVDYDSGVGASHLRRLLAVEGVGLGAGLAAASLRLGLPFWWEVLLVGLVVAGLSSLISFVRKQADG